MIYNPRVSKENKHAIKYCFTLVKSLILWPNSFISFTAAVALVPQEPKETSAVLGQLGTTLLAKPVTSVTKPNVGLTAEIERPNQGQVGVVVIPKSAQTPPAKTLTATVQGYAPPSSLSMTLLTCNNLQIKR